jgi:hypothetical protein
VEDGWRESSRTELLAICALQEDLAYDCATCAAHRGVEVVARTQPLKDSFMRR